jgi:hypothetical protein
MSGLKLSETVQDWLPVLGGVLILSLAALLLSLSGQGQQQLAQAGPDLSQVGADATAWQGPPERPQLAKRIP